MASLRTKMFVVFALIATLPLLALSYLAVGETRQALEEEVGRSQEDTARAAAAFVGAYVENAKGVLAGEVARGPLRDAAELQDVEAILEALRVFRARSAYEGDPIFSAVAFLDGRGVEIAAEPATAAQPGRDLSADPAFREPIARADLVVLAPFEGKRGVPVAAPVLSEGRVLGVVLATLDMDELGEELQAFALGRAENIVLADATGQLLVHPGVFRAADWSQVEPVRLATARYTGHVEYADPVTGEANVAGYTTVPGLGWAVLDTSPTSEAYAALTRLSAGLIVLSGVLVGGILLASVVLARQIVQPVRALTTAARSLSSGDLAARIESKGDDEIAELAQAFNHMAERISESVESLRRSEARYRNLVESANDVILTVEPDGALSFAGPLAERLLGWAPADIQGRPASNVVHPDDRARFEEAVKRVLARGQPVLWVMHRAVGRDGALRTFRSNFSPIMGPEGTPGRVLVVSRDITAQRLQERFRENSFQMARLVSAETDLDALATQGLSIALASGPHPRGALYVTTPHGLRQAAVASSGLPDEPVWNVAAARSLAERAVASLAPVSSELAVAVPLLERGEAVGALLVEEHERAPAGEDVEVLSTLGSQLAVGIRRSLFEARLKEYAAELETRVEARTAELQAKSEEMESFLYSVSHDLKAPLISIEGYAQSLLEDHGHLLEGDGALFLERIRKNATLMETLILDILELSRIGRIRESIEDVDMDKLLGDIASRIEDRYQAAGGRIEVQPDLPRVHGEPKRIQQLFTNLIENALKYRHPGRVPVVRVMAERTEDGVVLRVADNGRGIPAASLDQLFRIFQRLPPPDGMEDPGGTGMGLAIVKRIVDTHGGRIWVGSVEGEGTVFNVLLPAAKQEVRASEGPRPDR